MNELRKSLNKCKWDSYIIAILSVVVGVLAIIFPNETGGILCIVAGVALIVAGVATFVRFLAYGGFLFGGYALILSITTIALGVFCLTFPGLIQNIMTVLFGIFIIVDSAQTMAESLEVSRVHMPGWVCMFILSLVTAMLGVCVMFSSFDTVMIFAGISLIVDGVRNFITTAVFASKVRKARKELGKYAGNGYLGDGSEEN